MIEALLYPIWVILVSPVIILHFIKKAAKNIYGDVSSFLNSNPDNFDADQEPKDDPDYINLENINLENGSQESEDDDFITETKTMGTLLCFNPTYYLSPEEVPTDYPTRAQVDEVQFDDENYEEPKNLKYLYCLEIVRNLSTIFSVDKTYLEQIRMGELYEFSLLEILCFFKYSIFRGIVSNILSSAQDSVDSLVRESKNKFSNIKKTNAVKRAIVKSFLVGDRFIPVWNEKTMQNGILMDNSLLVHANKHISEFTLRGNNDIVDLYNMITAKLVLRSLKILDHNNLRISNKDCVNLPIDITLVVDIYFENESASMVTMFAPN